MKAIRPVLAVAAAAILAALAAWFVLQPHGLPTARDSGPDATVDRSVPSGGMPRQASTRVEPPLPGAAVGVAAGTPGAAAAAGGSAPGTAAAASAAASAAAAGINGPEHAAATVELDQVHHMITDYHTLMGENPVGTNAEIMHALMGGNAHQATLGPPDGQKLNDKGELTDRWGTPYFFHQLSRDRMEVHSAGPDKIMGTADDLIVK